MVRKLGWALACHGPPRRVIHFQHRLASPLGHRFNEVLAISEATERCFVQSFSFISALAPSQVAIATSSSLLPTTYPKINATIRGLNRTLGLIDDRDRDPGE